MQAETEAENSEDEEAAKNGGPENIEHAAEGEKTSDENTKEGDPKDLIAEKDATIVEIVTRKGVPQVHAGDTVKAGDLLVSGRVEVLNDAKEVIGYQYQTSDADIYGATVLEYEDQLETVYEKEAV